MVEKRLLDLFRRSQKQKIAIMIDGGIISSDNMYASLPNLIEKLREIGDIKVAEVIYEVKIPEKDYEYLTQSGFNYKVVPGNLDLNLLSDTYDLILSDNSIDTLVFGTTNDSLIPLVTELRKKVTIFALTNKEVSKGFEEAFDGIIDISKVDEFTFTTTDLSELDSIIGVQGEMMSTDVSIDWGSVNKDANIGPVSEDLDEQAELVEELKLQEQIKNGKGNSKHKTRMAKKPVSAGKPAKITEKKDKKPVKTDSTEDTKIIEEKNKVKKTEAKTKSEDSTAKKDKSEIKKVDKTKKTPKEKSDNNDE